MPENLLLTHFGVIENAKEHISEMRRRLFDWGHKVRQTLNDNLESDELRAKSFHTSEMNMMRSIVDQSLQKPYNYMGQPVESWYGLARYWRKKKGVDQ